MITTVIISGVVSLVVAWFVAWYELRKKRKILKLVVATWRKLSRRF